jgi:hypothetical protein
MIELIILKICFTSACFGWLYVEKFTANYGKLERLLNCSFCVAGWVSIGATIINYKTFGIDTTFYVFVVPLYTMILVGIINKLIIIPYK